MKKAFILFIIVLCANVGFSQRFYATVFDNLPQSYQLYPRNEKNEASVPISGKIEIEGWSYFSLKVYRNKQLIAYQRAPISYKNSLGTFAFTPVVIKAEKAEYDFKIFAVKGTDSLDLVTRENVVAGDVYVLTGQSNSTAFFSEAKTNEFCRTFGKITGTYNIEDYNPADTLWALSNQEVYFKNVGTLGYQFQKYILDNFGIPTCLINAGFHWSSARQHANRTASNPADLTNGYGRMLYRLQKAGVDKYVKALIYRQGETEAYGEGSDFGGYFDIFYKNLKLDLPSIKQLYVYQIDIINPAVGEAPKVRETQRALADKYQNLQVVASVGTAGFDGLHYTTEGYTQNATELGWLAGRDFYNVSNTDNIDAPNVRKAYFSQADKSEITITFPVGQELTWNEKTRNLLMKDFFYLDGVAGNVVSGTTVGNKVILTLNTSSSATKISYLPSFIEPTSPDYPYTGPYITNKKGLRALSFYEFKLEEVPTTKLSAVATNFETIKLQWEAITGINGYIIERKTASTAFQEVAQLNANTLVYEDKSLKGGELYTYRIKAVGNYWESLYANAEAKTLAYLATPVLAVTVVYNNSLSLSWQAVTLSTAYQIERRVGSEDFKLLSTQPANQLTLVDKDLTPNTAYAYRIKAIGNLTESLYTIVESKTPALLATPVLQAESIAYSNAKITWKSIPNATSYVLERKVTESGNYVELAKLDATRTDFSDMPLTEKTNYYYRLKAFGDKTESLYAAALTVTTQSVLGIEEEQNWGLKLYPNPNKGLLIIDFPKSVNGQISIVDFRGVKLVEQPIKQSDIHQIDLSHLGKGNYIVIFNNADISISKKLILE
ncbi:T9SS type A sorting domain-containing protein [Arcicella aquatica]|uniref:T9SS type A sorting domain-containing protein n=1 Tax=Arcicella aquatica TaxID=217141 RepID=A0ABU5QQF0_9BACT|nr:T9SS type A sorting domain-containing protein [Arcicella aquatica]MEA5258919.1 T9SS type A sorting domain-containing protein [Arcicella aquatica]